MKSSWLISKGKIGILTILEALNFDFWKNVTLENVKHFQIFKSRAAQLVKMAGFGDSKGPKSISRKVKIEKKFLKFSHCVPIPIWAVQVC